MLLVTRLDSLDLPSEYEKSSLLTTCTTKFQTESGYLVLWISLLDGEFYCRSRSEVVGRSGWEAGGPYRSLMVDHSFLKKRIVYALVLEYLRLRSAKVEQEYRIQASPDVMKLWTA